MEQQSSQTTGRYSQAAHETVDRVAQRVHPAVDRVAEGAHNAVDRLAEMADATSARVHRQTEQLTAARDRLGASAGTYVRENPLTALGIALAAGYVISRLLGTR